MSDSGFGTTISYGTDGETYVELARVAKTSGPGRSVDKITTFDNDDTDRVQNVSPGPITLGAVKVDVNFAAANHTALDSLIGVTKYWKIAYPDGDACTFQGFIDDDSGVDAPQDGAMSGTLSIQCTTMPVFAVYTPPQG